MSATTTLPTFDARAIRDARRARGWSIERLAAEADLSANGVHHLESGYRRPRAETLARLCAVLDIDMSECFTPRVPV